MNLDKRLLRLLGPHRVRLGISVGLGVAGGALLVIQAYWLARVISRVFLDGDDLRAVSGLLAGLVAVAAGRAVALWGSEAAASDLAIRIKSDLRMRLLEHLSALGPAYTRGERSGELAATATTGIEELDAYFSQYIPQIAFSTLVPLTMLLIILPIDVLSGVVLLLTAPLIPFFMILIGTIANALSRRQWTALSRMSAHFLDVLQGLTTLKLFGRSRDQIAIIARVSDRFRDTTMDVLRVAFLSALVLELLSTISTAIVAVQIGLRLLYGHIQFEEALFVLILAPEFYLPLRALGTRFHAGMTGVTAAGRIFDVLETPLQSTAPLPDITPAAGAQPGALRFDAVHYTYPGADASDDRPALHGITFRIEPGQTVALVGPSGAGKSTVISLLLRFIEPSAGQISVGDRPLAAVPPDVWRSQVGWVPQHPYLLAASAADNIRLARPDAPLGDVIRVAQQARADAFIRALPHGYDTPIGERGARLSGGQAQRIALARAFLKNAPLLILDEATSNLDPATEAEIAAAMRSLMQGRTTLIIAHRLSTVQNADQIVVLDAGRVVETGRHAELVRSGHVYSRLVTAHQSG
jgi:ATP-binding cassette subfamily C protein CydD